MSDRLTAAIEELVAALRAEVLRPEPRPERLLSVTQAAEALDIGRTLVYREIAAGRLRSVKIGRRRLIPETAMAVYMGLEEGLPWRLSKW